MKLHEIYSDLIPTKRTSVFNIPARSNYDYRLGPLPESDIEKQIGKMEDEIEYEQTHRDIQVPLHMRNEYYDDEYGELLDDETESHLLDREVNRASMMARGVAPPELPFSSRRPGAGRTNQ